MMIKIGIFFIGLFLLIAFYETQISRSHYLTSFADVAYSIYPVWLLGIILIFIGYLRKSKSDTEARELREKSNLKKKDEDKLK